MLICRLLLDPSKLCCSEYCWYKDEVQTARIFFYLRILQICLKRIPDEVFGMELAPLMFLYPSVLHQ